MDIVLTDSSEKQSENATTGGITIPGFAVVSDSKGSNFVSAREVWRALKNSQKLIWTVTLIFALAGAALAFLMTPKYQSEVLVSYVTETDATSGIGALASQFSGIAGLAGIDLSSGDNQRSIALATLRSREFTTSFIREKQLKPRLFEELWDRSSENWLATEEPPTDMEAFKRFDDLRHVSEDKASGLIGISMKWHDRNETAEWSNDLVASLNRHLREEAIEEAQTSISYLRDELDKTNMVELRQIIFGLIENQISQIMLASVRDEYALKVIDPAVPSDAGDYSTPPRAVIVAAFALAGLLLGVFFSLARFALSER